MKKFERSIEELREIIEKLESGNIPLEDSLSLFEKGVKILNSANKKLSQMEKKVEILVKDSDGKIKREEFDTD
ncbi:MAG: exodeoxyribonuclease VII small subunit [Candidatus Dadabacteria bacterium]|nr:exodeoxyribonuclease VII small subunit [Candidatus Dadabacteria bacterium]NIS08284.1 exodeoxyribonuclease VII small subunit [Candidatus Dadabacteria bacterium]NIV41568.1 exodeoxyribonuclease VII small subunit [Candidatus Dadabacteria bacterium]NIY21775.1 exodeoxyribonuclease VII small subunit [Candidatus Dadabacteria bacterium]